MTKALFKKQMLEIFSWLYKDRKSGKLRSAKGIITYTILYLIILFLSVRSFTVPPLCCVNHLFPQKRALYIGA